MEYEEYEEYRPFLPVLLELATGCATLDGTRNKKQNVTRIKVAKCVLSMLSRSGKLRALADAAGEAIPVSARSMATGCTCTWASDRSAVHRAVYRTGHRTLMPDLKP